VHLITKVEVLKKTKVLQVTLIILMTKLITETKNLFLGRSDQWNEKCMCVLMSFIY